MFVYTLIFYSCRVNAQLTILGSNSAAPTRTRNPSSQLLHLDGEMILIDCGEATQKRLLLNRINYQKIRYVFISHLHGDHFLGLFGLLNTMSLNRRRGKLTVICPVGLNELNQRVTEIGNAHENFEVEFIELEAEQEHEITTEKWEVKAIPLSHRVPCFGYLFHEKQIEKPLNVTACEQQGIPVSAYSAIKAGEDFVLEDGTTIPNSALTFDFRPPVRYAYMTDTLYRPDLASKFANCGAVYHEATYLHNLLDRAEKTGHSTALQAAQFASQSSTNQLLIGHFSSRYHDTEAHLEEAKTVFPNTFIAEEGKTFEIS